VEGASGVEQSSSRWASPTVALIVGIVALALAIGQLPLDLATHMVDQSVLVLPFGVVGYVIARRQAGNPVGWILIGIAGLFLLSNDAGLSRAAMHGARGEQCRARSAGRRRIQRRVDRRFNRAKYDSETMLALFAGRLRDSVELDAVRDDIATAVYQALELAFVGVWIKAGS
jgi:hypothetical protein